MKKLLGILSLMLCATPMIYAQVDGNATFESSDVAMTLNGAAAKGKVIASGSCGANVKYELYDDYSLRIYGNGAMSNFYHMEGVVSTSPWGKDVYKKIKSAVIEDGVTHIGDDSFYACSSLVEVTIANSVESIGEEAFEGCSALTKISIPNSVKSIARCAFSGCKALTKINIPNSVTFIEYLVFSGCSSLVEVNLPNNIKTIGTSLFERCSSIEKIKIPNSVTSIEGEAFEKCSSLKEIKIPNSVTNIGSCAFDGCDKLKYVTFGESVKKIGEQTFPQSNDEDLVIEITSETPAALRGADAFGFLCTIYVPENALETYLNAKFWKEHADQIKARNYITGASSISCEKSEKKTAIYNLQGHKVTDMQPHGIYIVNGKKVMK